MTRTAHVREQAGEQRVGGDVEGHAEAHVARALVHLAAKLAVGHVELREHVARRKSHLLECRRVPRREQDTPVRGVGFDLMDHLSQLVHPLVAIVRVTVCVLGAKVPPLEAVDGTQVALLAVLKPDAV